MAREAFISTGAVIGICLTVVVIIGGGLYGCPRYGVYSAQMAGEAELAQAEQNRQVLVRTAMAKRDSASLEAEAEVARAKGVAEANKIVGDSLKGNEAYLRYLWINKLDESTNRQVIYIPTEGGLPILESVRLGGAANSSPVPSK